MADRSAKILVQARHDHVALVLATRLPVDKMARKHQHSQKSSTLRSSMPQQQYGLVQTGPVERLGLAKQETASTLGLLLQSLESSQWIRPVANARPLDKR
jgi:hypothetical protein